jgi:hypothetical protein
MTNRVRRMWINVAIIGACCAGTCNFARADVLGSVEWAGHEATSDAIKGKAVFILQFVTWCPICNKWAPEMLDEIKAETADKPVVFLAIATDVDATAAKAYMTKRNFTGPNILYGSDATINAQLGVDAKNLWNFAWFAPDGKLMYRGPCGFSSENGKNEFLLVQLIKDGHGNSKAKFSFLSEDMSADLKKIAWAAELGDLPALAQFSKSHAQELLSSGDRDQFRAICTKALDGQLKSVKRKFIGDIPEQIEAFRAANKLSIAFPDVPQAKTAAKLAAALSNDPAFRKELSAQKNFQAGVAAATYGKESQALRLLHNAADDYPDTYFGERAKKLLDMSKKN